MKAVWPRSTRAVRPGRARSIPIQIGLTGLFRALDRLRENSATRVSFNSLDLHNLTETHQRLLKQRL